MKLAAPEAMAITARQAEGSEALGTPLHCRLRTKFEAPAVMDLVSSDTPEATTNIPLTRVTSYIKHRQIREKINYIVRYIPIDASQLS